MRWLVDLLCIDKQRKATVEVAIYVASSKAHGANEGKFTQQWWSWEIP